MPRFELLLKENESQCTKSFLIVQLTAYFCISLVGEISFSVFKATDKECEHGLTKIPLVFLMNNKTDGWEEDGDTWDVK